MMSKKTVLYDAHVAIGGEMVDFAGYLMPVRYKTSIVEEHVAVRENVGMFDTSHMGRYFVGGKDALAYLNYLVPRNLDELQDEFSGYTFMLNENGGFRDDVIIYRFTETEYMVICNASNRDKIWKWMMELADKWKLDGKDLTLDDMSDFSCMIAVQGPRAISLLEELFNQTLPEKRFRTKDFQFEGKNILFSTTGYTGASGGELIIFDAPDNIKSRGEKLWQLLLDNKVIPCALGSRDTLRLEAGYRLYGNDLSEEMSLLESGLDYYPFVDLEKNSGYIGQDAVLAKRGNVEKIVVGFRLEGRGIPRHEYKILIDGKIVGEVLSGTQSPMTKQPFGLALVPISHKEVGSKFDIQIRKKTIPAVVIKLPIYDQTKYGVMIRK